MVRFALLGCAAAGLALSLPAQAQEAGDQAPAVASDTKPAFPKVKRAPRKIAVLPPARPADEDDGIVAIVEAAPDHAPLIAGSEPALPAQFKAVAAQAPITTPAPIQTAAATVPPLRPAFRTDTQPEFAPQPIKEQAAAATVTDGPVPPPRPDFTAIEAPAAAAAAVAVLPPERPAFAANSEAAQLAALPEQPAAAPAPQPAQPRSLFGALFGQFPQPATPATAEEPMIRTGRDFLDERIAYHAKLNAVPAALVHRVVVRESKYNPRAVGRGGALGLMQIKHATARGLGYEGSASGLLDAETNLTYAVKYLAGAYRLADGSYDRAVQHYARGYYYEAKRRNARVALRQRNERLQKQADAAGALEQAAPAAPAAPRSLFTESR